MGTLVRELESAQTDYKQDQLRLVFLSGDWIPLSLPYRIKRFSPTASVISFGGATEATILSKIKYVLQDATKQARKIDVLNDTKRGLDLLMIHNAQKKYSPTGKVIKMKSAHNVTTYYTDEQRLYI